MYEVYVRNHGLQCMHSTVEVVLNVWFNDCVLWYSSQITNLMLDAVLHKNMHKHLGNETRPTVYLYMQVYMVKCYKHVYMYSTVR